MSWDLVKACTVAIASAEDGSIRGTGFFISSVGHLLTCAHVVEATGGWEKVRVKGQPVSLVYLGDRSVKKHLFLWMLLHGFESCVLTDLPACFYGSYASLRWAIATTKT